MSSPARSFTAISFATALLMGIGARPLAAQGSAYGSPSPTPAPARRTGTRVAIAYVASGGPSRTREIARALQTARETIRTEFRQRGFS